MEFKESSCTRLVISTVLVVEVEFELGVSTIVVVGFKFGAVNVGEEFYKKRSLH